MLRSIPDVRPRKGNSGCSRPTPKRTAREPTSLCRETRGQGEFVEVDPSCELPLTRMAQRLVAPELAHVTNRRAVGFLIRSVPRLDSCNQNGALAM